MGGREHLLEVSDLLVDLRADGTRVPVRRDDVVAALVSAGDRRAASMVEALPAPGGVLDGDAVDRLLVAVHVEIQRLSEEFRQGARMRAMIEPLLAGLRSSGVPPPYRIVDVGCGTGYVVRWLASRWEAPDVELVGVDLNPALVAAARRLAHEEGIGCRFEVGDAFAPAVAPTVVISTGLLHHFRGDDLVRFFAGHEESGAVAYVHSDFQPSRIAGAGAWMFHRTRMRLELSRHDGVRSAQRAHPPEVLARSAALGAPTFEPRVLGRRVRMTPFPCVLTNLVGCRREHWAAVERGFARRAARLERIS